MEPEFGEMFREERKRAGMRLGDVSALLGVSVTFLSDVERGARPPLSAARIHVAAQHFKLAASHMERLLKAAARRQGSIELQVPDTEQAQAAAAALQRHWRDDADVYRKILEAFGGVQKK